MLAIGVNKGYGVVYLAESALLGVCLLGERMHFTSSGVVFCFSYSSLSIRFHLWLGGLSGLGGCRKKKIRFFQKF